MRPCTCTLACQGLSSIEAEGVDVEEVYCKAAGIDPTDTRECDGYPGLLVDPEGVDTHDGFEPCCGDPGDCGTCGAGT